MNKKLSSKIYVAAVFAALYLAYSAVYIARLNLSMAAPKLLEDSILSTKQIGYLGAVFSVVYAIGRLLNGWLSDRVAPYIMICSGLVLIGTSNFAFGMLPVFPALLLFWAVNAFAQSMLWSSILCVLVRIFRQETSSKASSYMVTSVAFGNIVAIILNTGIINSLGVKYAFFVPGLISLVMAVIVLFLIFRIKNPIELKNRRPDSVFNLLRQKTLILSILMALFHGMIKENVTVWMAVYFVDTYAINLSDTSNFVLFIPLVGFIGRIAYPVLYRFCSKNEHTTSILGFSFCSVAAFLIVIFKVNAIWSLVFLSVIYASVSLVNTSLLSIVPIDFSKTGNVASVSGILDFATYSGGGIGSLVYGLVIAHIGYAPMFLSWAIICTVCVLLAAIAARIKRKSMI